MALAVKFSVQRAQVLHNHKRPQPADEVEKCQRSSKHLEEIEGIKNHRKNESTAEPPASRVSDATIFGASHDAAFSCKEAGPEAPCGVDVHAELKNSSIIPQSYDHAVHPLGLGRQRGQSSLLLAGGDTLITGIYEPTRHLVEQCLVHACDIGISNVVGGSKSVGSIRCIEI